MRQHIWITFILLILIPGCIDQYQKDLSTKLLKYDKNLVTEPNSVLDSLANINPDTLSKQNRAYYTLIKTIAQDNTSYQFESDSAILTAVKWFRKSKEYEKFARSLLYHGIVKYRINPADTTIYPILKQSDSIIQLTKIENSQTEALCYYYLANVNYNNRNYNTALKYLLKNAEAMKQIEDLSNLAIAEMDLSRVYILLDSMKQAEKRIHNAEVIINENHLNNLILDLYKLKNTFFIATKQKEKSIITAKYIYSLSGEVKIFSNLAISYNKPGYRDSAMFYVKKVISALQSKGEEVSYIQCLYYANLLQEAGNDKEAAKLYKQTFEEFENSIGLSEKKRILELEQKYNVAIREAKITQTESHKKILWMILFCSILLILSLFFIIRQQKKYLKNEKKNIILKDESLFKANILNIVLDTNSTILNNLINDLRKKSSLEYSSTLSFINEQNNIIDQATASQITKMIEIFNLAEIESHPLLGNLAEFGKKEKLIILLLYFGFSQEYISRTIKSSTSSIRGLKHNIAQKVGKSTSLLDENKKLLSNLVAPDKNSDIE